MWIYSQSTGRLTNPNGVCVGNGYSGNTIGLDNPLYQNIHNIGPCPQGTYTIGTWFNDLEKGPIVAHLIPQKNTNTFGRSEFMIHGDNIEVNHTASDGCIILTRTLRELMRDSKDMELKVVA